MGNTHRAYTPATLARTSGVFIGYSENIAFSLIGVRPDRESRPFAHRSCKVRAKSVPGAPHTWGQDTGALILVGTIASEDDDSRRAGKLRVCSPPLTAGLSLKGF